MKEVIKSAHVGPDIWMLINFIGSNEMPVNTGLSLVTPLPGFFGFKVCWRQATTLQETARLLKTHPIIATEFIINSTGGTLKHWFWKY